MCVWRAWSYQVVYSIIIPINYNFSLVDFSVVLFFSNYSLYPPSQNATPTTTTFRSCNWINYYQFTKFFRHYLLFLDRINCRLKLSDLRAIIVRDYRDIPYEKVFDFLIHSKSFESKANSTHGVGV